MTQGIKTMVYPTRDAAQAKALISIVAGVAPHTDQPYYVGWNVDGQEIGLNPNGFEQGAAGPVAYWHVADVEATFAELLAAGATAVQQPTDVGGGALIATVADSDGNVIGLRAA
ncbi:VOC family protein [Jatrophihabitans sp.]|uniref:VOC family protein n=1 Tax=Jatrophihabitans sp. TaxID=1932789 RepID=UPI0030C70670|nr:glyoxalase [Jatrophihabitans sp.]